MAVKAGLLIAASPKLIPHVLSTVVVHHVKSVLYIQLLNSLSETAVETVPRLHHQYIHFIYSQAAACCPKLDVRLLLYRKVTASTVYPIKTKRLIEMVIFAGDNYDREQITQFMDDRIETKSDSCHIRILNCAELTPTTFELNDNLLTNTNNVTGDHVVLGGTFDRLHNAHKVFLSEAVLRSNRLVSVGVTSSDMLKNKILTEMIEPLERRIEVVQDFLNDICPMLHYSMQPITDPLSSAATDPTMNLIVVSDETVSGAQKINEKRMQAALKPLDIVPISILDNVCPKFPIEEGKISSSNARIQLLGTLWKPVNENPNISSRPYVIGFAGGVATGKSTICLDLMELGAFVINADKVGHKIYERNKPVYGTLVETFGADKILDANGDVDRAALGSIVFQSSEALQTLNRIVWPAMEQEIRLDILNCQHNIVVVEAAILLNANWDAWCHEVWVSLATQDIQLKRLMERNKLTQTEAMLRIQSQPASQQYVNKANVIFCTNWAHEIVHQQVHLAWSLLQNRLPK